MIRGILRRIDKDPTAESRKIGDYQRKRTEYTKMVISAPRPNKEDVAVGNRRKIRAYDYKIVRILHEGAWSITCMHD